MFSGFPFVAQHDSMHAVLACLAMICRHYGHYQSLSGLAHLCHATKEGVSMQAISEAAENLGFMVRAGKIASSDLRRSPLPAILHWNQNHFVVLYKVTRSGKYHVADPGKGLIKIHHGRISVALGNLSTRRHTGGNRDVSKTRLCILFREARKERE